MKKYSSIAIALVIACGGKPAPTAYFDLSGTLAADTFWNLPVPSDLRLDAGGAPDFSGFPNKRNVPVMTSLLSIVPARAGWPVMPIAYVRFTDAVPPRALTDVIVPGADAPALLVDIDPNSPERGATIPIVAQTFAPDDFIASDLVALAPRPGFVLRAGTQYAYVIRRAFAPGFVQPAAFAELAAGKTPSGARGAAAATLYAPLWDTLATLAIARDDVLVATVFTTGDVVARTRARSEAIRGLYQPTIDNVTLDATTYSGFCHLTGTITMPQFQSGTQPFDTGGVFVTDANDVPQQQATMPVPVSITLPATTMPATGWPLYQFFHGSGGVSTGVVDLGPSLDSSDHPTPGEGPGYVVAHHGIAAASSAMPLNPERFPGANDYEYLNINNLAAFPFTFQQGVFEQRMLLDALLALRVPQATVGACAGIASPTGEHFFDPQKLVAGGQSMGGMYTNMVGAVEPRFGAFVPTGAGGFWNLMILETTSVPGARSLLGTALAIDDSQLVFMHPALDVMAIAFEPAEPLASMARIARRPLPGFTARHVYEPTGKDDTYFPIDVYDAAALAYGNEQAGDTQWPSMQDALALDNLGGILPYNVRADLAGGTRVVVQYLGDGIVDPHYIFRQLDAVKHQYGCYLESFLRDGVPTVPAPGAIFDPCP